MCTENDNDEISGERQIRKCLPLSAAVGHRAGVQKVDLTVRLHMNRDTVSVLSRTAVVAGPPIDLSEWPPFSLWRTLFLPSLNADGAGAACLKPPQVGLQGPHTKTILMVPTHKPSLHAVVWSKWFWGAMTALHANIALLKDLCWRGPRNKSMQMRMFSGRVFAVRSRVQSGSSTTSVVCFGGVP